RKLEKLKNIKNMLLEKMFADEKTLKPAIRFKEFTNDWEQRRLGNIVLPYRIKNNLGLNLKSYSISNKFGFVYQNDFFKNGGKAVFANKKNSLIVEPFSFAYNPARIDVGSIGYYKNNECCLISPLYEVFKTQENINDNFVLCWFKSNLFSKIINNNKEGSVRNTLYIRNILDEFMSIPNIYEQQNISSLFYNLDTSITLHQRNVFLFIFSLFYIKKVSINMGVERKNEKIRNTFI
ncbi:restriction endonuclease subunit S, partial [Mycoplasma sp. U97]|uniref:restriction endonuclease subunit S n=1 Tax=Mycoplasma tauri TaxID=547987 RepID=UPI001CBF50BA